MAVEQAKVLLKETLIVHKIEQHFLVLLIVFRITILLLVAIDFNHLLARTLLAFNEELLSELINGLLHS